MSRYGLIASAFLIFSLAACATTGKPAYTGQSLARENLQRDTMESIRFRESFQSNPCKDFKVVDIEVTGKSVSPVYDGERLTSGKWTERWSVSQCGKVVQYKVEYSVNAMGASVINLSPPQQDGEPPKNAK